MKPLSIDFLNALSPADREHFLTKLAELEHEGLKKTSPFESLRQQALKGEITTEVYFDRFVALCNELRQNAPEAESTPLTPAYAPWRSEEEKAQDMALAMEIGINFGRAESWDAIHAQMKPYREGLQLLELAGICGAALTLSDNSEAIEEIIAQMIAPYDSLNALAEDYALMGCIGLPVLNQAVTREHLKRLVAPFRAAYEQQAWPVKW